MTDVEVLVIGAGHAGLSVAYWLRRAGRTCLLLDAHERVGDAWRHRWDSLELFTPRSLDGLPGIAFPRGPTPFPGKDAVADYQEAYVDAMGFPIRLRSHVSGLRPVAGGFEATVGGDAIRSRAVVVTTGQFHSPRIPEFARHLDPDVVQLHSEQYRRPSQLPDGPVVIVGAANSGAEIAVEVARHRPTTLAISRLWPRAPKRFRDPRWWRLAYVRGYILRDRRLPAFLPWPLRRGMLTKVDVDRAVREEGLKLAPRATDAAGDRVCFADGSEVAPRTVIWATGFQTDHSWIETAQTGGRAELGRHGRAPVPGLWFVGSRFLFGINRDARAVARDLSVHLDRLG